MGYLDNTSDRASRIKRHLGAENSENARREEIKREETRVEEQSSPGTEMSMMEEVSSYVGDENERIGSLIRSVGEVVDALSDEGKRDEAYFVARNSSQVYPCDYTSALIDKCINSD